MNENLPKPRRVRRKAGPPFGHFLPGKMPRIPLSDDEFKLVANALPAEDVARRPGFAGQGFDHGFRAALDYALMHYVAARRAAGALPSQREATVAFAHLAKKALEASKLLEQPSDILREAVFTADGGAWSEVSTQIGPNGEFQFLIETAIDGCLAVADAAIKKAVGLNETAGQKVKPRPIDTIAFIMTLREILKSAGISTSVGSDTDAEIAEDKYPLVRVARLMLKLAIDRMDAACAQKEAADVLNQAPITFVRFVRGAKITGSSRK